MQLRDDSCDSNSPDFKGYGPSGQAICDGRASCPDGGTPGYVGSGDTLSAICYSNPAEPNENCDGQFGVQDGVQVCIPNVGADDPDFPDCDGVVGTFNGVKRCIDKPGGHAGCSAGETPGYAGAGDNATFTCIPSDYKPDSCPPGQYVTNAATGGFGCATTSPTPPKDPNAPPTTGGTSTSTTTNKDADGNVIGTSETETKLPDGAMEITFPDLLQDQPQNNYFTETDEFGDSQLEKLDADTASILSEFTGADGAFTQRNSLESASDRLLGLFGYSTSCSGDLIFYQSENRTIKASCEKLNKMRELLGWFLYVSTLMGIYNILMQKQEN
jgi:hypothetical protein